MLESQSGFMTDEAFAFCKDKFAKMIATKSGINTVTREAHAAKTLQEMVVTDSGIATGCLQQAPLKGPCTVPNDIDRLRPSPPAVNVRFPVQFQLQGYRTLAMPSRTSRMERKSRQRSMRQASSHS
jgi:hypothetical protein